MMNNISQWGGGGWVQFWIKNYLSKLAKSTGGFDLKIFGSQALYIL